MTNSIHFNSSSRACVRPDESRNFITFLRLGLLAGCTVSWFVYSANQNLLRHSGLNLVDKSPFPLIFTGMLGVALVEGIGLAYEVAKRILGERTLFDQMTTDEVDLLTPLDKYRYRAWKVIYWVEQRGEVVDRIYSAIFRIRSDKEIVECAIPEREFTLMEIARVAFKEQLKETMAEDYPTNGYSVLLLNFALGISDKVNQISQKIQIKKIEENRQSNEDKVWCDILDTWAWQYEQNDRSFDFPPLTAPING